MRRSFLADVGFAHRVTKRIITHPQDRSCYLLLPALHYVAREGFVLAYRYDLFYFQVAGYWHIGHQDLTQLIGRFDVHNPYHSPLPRDLVKRDDLAGFYGLERRLRFLLPYVHSSSSDMSFEFTRKSTKTSMVVSSFPTLSAGPTPNHRG